MVDSGTATPGTRTTLQQRLRDQSPASERIRRGTNAAMADYSPASVTEKVLSNPREQPLFTVKPVVCRKRTCDHTVRDHLTLLTLLRPGGGGVTRLHNI